MKKYPLAEEEIHVLLDTEPVGRLASMGGDGFPYITPVHFVFFSGADIYSRFGRGRKADQHKKGFPCGL